DGCTVGDDGELGGPGRAFEVLELQMFGRVETFDLGGDPCGESARVEMSDGSDSAPAVDQAVPRLISGVAERGDGTDAGDDDRIVGGGASGGDRRGHRSILSEAE